MEPRWSTVEIGYVSEATRALADFALIALGVHAVVATVELPNPASVRVLEKVGVQRLQEDECRGKRDHRDR